MDTRQVLEKLTELTALADSKLEFALKLKNGLLVVRDPLFYSGTNKRRPFSQRKITLVDPKRMPKDEKIADYGMRKITRKDSQLTYTRQGKKLNKVESLWSPADADPNKVLRAKLKMKGTFVPHLDRRQIESTTIAASFGGRGGLGARPGGVETDKLAKFYGRLGYKAEPAGHPDHLPGVAIPMRRKPRPLAP